MNGMRFGWTQFIKKVEERCSRQATDDGWKFRGDLSRPCSKQYWFSPSRSCQLPPLLPSFFPLLFPSTPAERREGRTLPPFPPLSQQNSHWSRAASYGKSSHIFLGYFFSCFHKQIRQRTWTPFYFFPLLLSWTGSELSVYCNHNNFSTGYRLYQIKKSGNGAKRARFRVHDSVPDTSLCSFLMIEKHNLKWCPWNEYSY